MAEEIKNKIPHLDTLANNNHNDWLAAIQKSLKSGSIEELYSDYQNIAIDPFINPNIDRANPLKAQKRDWYIGVKIPPCEPQVLNAAMLYYLENGAEAIHCQSDDPDMALEGVHTDMIYLDGIKHSASKNQHQTLIHSSAGLLVDELTDICKQTIEHARSGADMQSIKLSIHIEAHLPIAVAKLRAMRVLWLNILNAHQIKLTPAFLVADIVSDKADADTAMIDLSAKAMYAALGNVDLIYLDAPAFDQNQRRIAMNIQHIMKLESKLHLVADPMAGAYAIESLTQQISTEVWARTTA